MVEILVKQNDTNKYLDLFQDENIVSINYSINTIKDISQTTGSYTKTIVLPDTPKNREVFGFVTDLSSDIGYNYDFSTKYKYNPNLKVKCWVLEDTISVLEGYIQINKYTISDTDKNITLEATIYADNTSFYIAMGDNLLTNIDFSEYDFILSPHNILTSWDNDLSMYRNGYYFPLIDYGHGWTLNDLQDLRLYQLNVKDFLPAIYVKTIWDKIFAEYGYSYTSEFLSSDPRFLNLVIPYYQQTFQNNALFNQDKIFHIGLSQSLMTGIVNVSTGWYSGKYDSAAVYTKAIINCDNRVVSGTGSRNLWYSGEVINPFIADTHRNTDYNLPRYSTYQFGNKIIPFNLTASPMFANGQYDTTAHTYENNTDGIFKQRFVLNTDVVTTYSNQDIVEQGMYYATGSTPYQGFNYILKVDFFREIDPTTGLTSSFWATGTGAKIPADLGPDPSSGAYTLCRTESGYADNLTHWLCDINFNSNVFNKSGKQIIPTGSSRYLGEFCVGSQSSIAITYSNAGPSYYPENSGDCFSWYYNDGYNQPDPYLMGLWVSGIQPYDFSHPKPYDTQATWQPRWGDWYQQLQLQTIYLDGDTTNRYYGASGSLMVNGNMPIQPGEKVRCVMSLGGKYVGQHQTGNTHSYKPPTTAYILSSTNFDNDAYTYSTANPLTQFWNDVSMDYITGQLISFNTIIPKNIKQRDFIQDIVRLHNLYIEANRSDFTFPNNLIIEPRDAYYKKGSVLDWRNKLDISQPINVQVLAETQYKRTTFSYKGDADWYNKQYTQNTNEIYGQYIYVLENEFLTNELKIESGFSPTPMTQLYSYDSMGGGSTLITDGGIIIPVIVSGNNIKPNSNSGPNGTVQTNLRLLYKNVIQTKNGDKYYVFNNKTDIYAYAGPYDNPYAPTYTLNWGQTRGEFFPTPTDQFFDNLVNTYWASLLTEMGDEDSRLVTCQMFLMPDDVSNFYFYDQVFLTINGVDGYYKVLSIDNYVPGINQTSQVTLLKSRSDLAVKTYRGSSSLVTGGSIIIRSDGGGTIIRDGGSTIGGGSIGGGF